MTSSIQVSPEMIEAGVAALFYARDGNTAAGAEHIVNDIYLAMKAHDLPQGDNIKPAIVKILRSHMTHGWDEAASEIAALVRPMSRSEQIMDTIDPAWADAGEIRSPIGDDDVEGVNFTPCCGVNAGENDRCPQCNKPITAIGSQSIEGERAGG